MRILPSRSRPWMRRSVSQLAEGSGAIDAGLYELGLPAQFADIERGLTGAFAARVAAEIRSHGERAARAMSRSTGASLQNAEAAANLFPRVRER